MDIQRQSNSSIESLLDLVLSDHILSFPMPPIHTTPSTTNSRFLAKLKNRANLFISKSPKLNSELLLSPPPLPPVQSPVLSHPMYSTSQDFIPYTPHHTRNRPSHGRIPIMRSTPNLRGTSVPSRPPMSPESPPAAPASPSSLTYSASSSGSTPNSPVTPVTTLFTPVQTQSPTQSQGALKSHPYCVREENSKPPPPPPTREVSPGRNGYGPEVDEPKVQIQVFPPTPAPSRPPSLLTNHQTILQRRRSIQPPSHPPPACPLPSPPSAPNPPPPSPSKRGHTHHPYALASLSPPPMPSKAPRHRHTDAALIEASDEEEEDWTLELLGIGTGTGLRRGVTRSSPSLKVMGIAESQGKQEDERENRGKLRKVRPATAYTADTGSSAVGDWTLSLPEGGVTAVAAVKVKTGLTRSPSSSSSTSSFSLSRAKSTSSLKPRSSSILLPIHPPPPSAPASLTRASSTTSSRRSSSKSSTKHTGAAPTSFKPPPAPRVWTRTRPGSPFPFASGGKASGEGDGEEVSRWIGF